MRQVVVALVVPSRCTPRQAVRGVPAREVTTQISGWQGDQRLPGHLNTLLTSAMAESEERPMAAAAHRSAVVIGQCIAHNTKNAAKVRVKRLLFDDNLNMYFPKHKNYYAHDPEGECKTGDIVVIRELPEKMTRVVTHSLVKLVYKYGDITDPISGKKVVVGKYR
ncbi:28S ribosomal protein S17, mitochondrial [Chionoecetes opilio]|uniref:28S ribosomal protein S17, mitochondrial n=1 Tax=Chionoecetes opilio TaxID=41210 RepID=A0A8J4XV29_CHIOP|nr:28S ribosomal protein S17, mitochondrial [Chionoecetes opilio]